MSALSDFAEEWIAAWNAHDLERVLSHYAEDIVFLSPMAALITGRGRVEGKAALRAYWSEAFKRNPNLHFTLTRVYEGADALTIAYDNHRRQHVTETAVFNEAGEVVLSTGCYAPIS